MTVVYCGTCGTANGTAAKFCRHCGAELGAQMALPSSNISFGISSDISSNAATKPSDALNPETNTPTNLRIVAPEAEIIPLAPANALNEPVVQLTQEESQASEALRRLREAKIIEAKQEEEARLIKQASSQSLSQRLAQPHSPKAPKPALSEMASLKSEPTPAPNKPSIPLVTPKELKNPPVPIRPQQPDSLETEPELPIIERYGSPAPDRTAARPSERITPALNSANAMQQVEAQNRSGFAVRLAASALGVSLLFGGIYAYRHQVFSGGLINAARNLLSPEEQSAQLLLASRTDLEEGKIEEATQKLERAVALTPADTTPRAQLADAYTQTGRTDEALRTLDGLLKIAPENLDARFKIANLLQSKGNLAEARAQYQKIINLGPDTQQAAQALEAVEVLDQTLNANTLANNNVENSRQRRNVMQKGMGPVLPSTTTMRPSITLMGRPPIVPSSNSSFDWSPRRALEAPDPATVATMHKELGIRYYNIREYSAALSELQKAARLTPSDKDIYYFLGGTYSGLGQPLKAFDHYKRCDGGTYATVAQNGAKKIEKAARKEYQQQQEQQYKNVPQTEAAAKNTAPNSALQNLSAPIISPLGGRAAFNNAPDK